MTGKSESFCAECLATIEYNRKYPESPKLYCNNCGRVIPKEANFIKLGRAIKETLRDV
jgi:hypothetical protein